MRGGVSPALRGAGSAPHGGRGGESGKAPLRRPSPDNSGVFRCSALGPRRLPSASPPVTEERFSGPPAGTSRGRSTGRAQMLGGPLWWRGEGARVPPSESLPFNFLSTTKPIPVGGPFCLGFLSVLGLRTAFFVFLLLGEVLEGYRRAAILLLFEKQLSCPPIHQVPEGRGGCGQASFRLMQSQEDFRQHTGRPTRLLLGIPILE